MGKKRKRRKKLLISPKQLNDWLNKATHQLFTKNYAGAIQTSQRILRYVPHDSPKRAEALERLATAQMMLKDFQPAYVAISEALKITPEQAHLWYNRGLLSRYTMRSAQAVSDFEKAVELEPEGEMAEQYAEALAESRSLAEEERMSRGPDFTLEELREQQETFQTALTLMNQRKWSESEEQFRRVIEMGDCLPQPHGNLALCMLMQKEYDEAEAALRRALEIDPDYDLAQRNLDRLPKLRESGETPQVITRNSMTEAEVGLTVKMVD